MALTIGTRPDGSRNVGSILPIPAPAPDLLCGFPGDAQKLVPAGQSIDPFLWNGVPAPAERCGSAGNAGGGVGVPAKVNGLEHRLFVAVRVQEAP